MKRRYWLAGAALAACANTGSTSQNRNSNYVTTLTTHTAPTPVATDKMPEHGVVDRDSVRAQVDKHFPEVRTCYQRASDPKLAGRVVVQFVVETTGKTKAASVKESSLHNRKVENCIRDAVASWEFEKPNGGMMIVSYPFEMKTVRAPTQTQQTKAAK